MMKNLHTRVACGLLLLFAVACSAKPPAGLCAAIKQRLAERTLAGAHVGVYVQSLRDGDIWYACHADESFIPASNAKIITAALALDYLKPDYVFHTRLYADGQVTNGVLDGNLVLQGGGDPSLAPDDLLALAKGLAAGDPARGIPAITAVHGRLLLDDNFFPRPAPLLGPWDADDLPWGYAAPAGALACHHDSVTLTARGTAAGHPVTVALTPDIGMPDVENRATTVTKAASALSVLPIAGRVRVSGKLGVGAARTEQLSIPDPTRFTGAIFAQALKQQGIAIGDAETGTADARMTLLADHVSAPVSALLATMLKESDNLYAEQFRWTLQALYSRENPLDMRYEDLLENFTTNSGMRWCGIHLEDGCGLSRRDAVTPCALARYLVFLADSPQADLFANALPLAGVDGTLRDRLRNTPAAGNAQAKTGTMHGVSSLSGYVHTAAGEPLVFSILCDKYAGSSKAPRALQDALVTLLAEAK